MRTRLFFLPLSIAVLAASPAARADDIGIGTPTAPPGDPVAPVPAPAAPVQGRAGTAPIGAGRVRVHLHAYRSKDIARLYVEQGTDRWALVCTSPCTVDLPPGALVRVALGDDYDEPHDFSLQAEAGREIELVVRPASKGPLAGGIVMTSIGGLTAIIGLALVAAASSTSVRDEGDLRTAGFVCLGIGGGLTIGGILLIANRSHEPRVNEQSYGRWRSDADAPVRSASLPSLLPPVVGTPLSVGFSF